MNIPNDAITFPVTLRCKDIVSGCTETAPARAAIRAGGMIEIVDVPKGWIVDLNFGDRHADPGDEDVYCCKKHAPWTHDPTWKRPR